MKYRDKILLRLAVFHLATAFLISHPAIGQPAESAAPSQPTAGNAKTVQETNVLKLEDAIRVALENHPRIRSSREKVGAQRAVVGQQLAGYYPTIRLNNFYRSSTASGTTTGSPEAFDFFSSQASFDMTLYNFGKREGAIQSARNTLNATQYGLRTSADEVVLAVKQAYFGYLQAKELVKVREETVRDRELLVRQARGFYEVGTRPRIDVARAESNLFSARADLIAAQNAVKVAWATLKNTMGVHELAEQPLSEDLSIAPVPMSLDQAKGAAFSARPDLLELEAQRKAQDQEIATARRGHLPDILFSADYGRRNTSRGGDTFPLQVTWQVQLSLNIPIFDGFRTTNRVEEALRNYHSVKAQEEEQRQQVALEVEQSYVRVIDAGERIKATEAAARAAKENLDLANGRYQVGVGSIIEVTDAETLNTDAQTNHINARYDYKILEAELIKAMGRQ
jgi:outer membrane protein